jgi:hypothetical protein
MPAENEIQELPQIDIHYNHHHSCCTTLTRVSQRRLRRKFDENVEAFRRGSRDGT